MSTAPITKKVVTPQAPPSDDKSNFEYVTIPTHDNTFDHAYEPIYINREKFEPGQTYFLHPDMARELRRIITVYEASQLRIVQPKKDYNALRNLRDTRGHSGQDTGNNLRD